MQVVRKKSDKVKDKRDYEYTKITDKEKQAAAQWFRDHPCLYDQGTGLKKSPKMKDMLFLEQGADTSVPLK